MRDLLSRHRSCSPDEVAAFRRYQLQHSHLARVVVPLLDEGRLLTVATVDGTVAIGSLKTFFGNIGRARCRDVMGADRFRVAEAAALLNSPAFSSDADVSLMRQRVSECVRRFEQPGSNPQVIVVDSANDCLIADGNKTAIAAFLFASSMSSGFQLPVFYLTAPDRVIPWII